MLPIEFEQKMRTLLGDEFEEFFRSYDKERAAGLRVNRLKMTEQEDESLPFSLRPVPWAQGGYYYDSGERPGKHPLHEAGVYYIQEPSAMAVASSLDPKPGEKVLDLCAAPGGKTTHAASLMGGEGFLLSNEIHPARAKILSQNVERMGLKNCVVTNEDSGRLVKWFPEFFDKIIVDAPCSGEGMFRKDEGAREQWSPDHVALCAGRQAEILDNAARMLKPGGRLVYSTCTFSPEENEGSIRSFLERHPEFETEDVKTHGGCFEPGRPEWTENGGEELKRTVRLWPHRLEGEGHYLALLKKNGGEPERGKGKAPAYVKDKRLMEDFYKFCRETLEPETAKEFVGRKEYVLFGDELYLVPPGMPDFSGLKVVRAGLHMGTLKKNRFEPSHGLALALKKEQALRAYDTCDMREAEGYLAGEAYQEAALGGSFKGGQPMKGWGLYMYQGHPLGWVKGAGGVLKNHYPKGLRWMNVQ